jgi:hypothetical protein
MDLASPAWAAVADRPVSNRIVALAVSAGVDFGFATDNSLAFSVVTSL